MVPRLYAKASPTEWLAPISGTASTWAPSKVDRKHMLQSAIFETNGFLSPLLEWGGDRKRLDAELDELKGLGVNMLRIMASSEGEGNEPYRMKPCLMTKPGVYNEEIFRGLDYFLDALAKRGFTAIGMCLCGAF